jgi:CheY-like chemotaxis protein
MIVEDIWLIANDLKESLTKLGYTVTAIVSSGEDAVKKAAQEMPDLILMDIVLSGRMDGIEAAEKIRSATDIPVIYLTAYSDEKKLERAKVTEPFGYLIKPVNDRELHTTIETALYRNRMEHERKNLFRGISTMPPGRSERFRACSRSVPTARRSAMTRDTGSRSKPTSRSIRGRSSATVHVRSARRSSTPRTGKTDTAERERNAPCLTP